MVLGECCMAYAYLVYCLVHHRHDYAAEVAMRGDNAKTINPESKAQKRAKQRARVDNACHLISVQLDSARAGSFKQREDALRRMLASLLLCLPHDLSREKKEDFITRFLQSAYNDEDEFYDMPHVEVDGDLVSIHGNFSLRKLAKQFQW
jgi:hypothetical protein